MKLTITLDLDGAAFENAGAIEVAHILADLAERLPDPLASIYAPINLYDANGNWIGEARID